VLAISASSLNFTLLTERAHDDGDGDDNDDASVGWRTHEFRPHAHGMNLCA
jgi:hypothetical protein